jgi:hypothetical protein
MADWYGLIFLGLLVVGALIGLKLLSRPRSSTADEFEKRAAENTTMMGAGMNALQELMNPEAAKAKEVITQMKEGRYMKKKKEGKAGGTDGEEDEEDGPASESNNG